MNERPDIRERLNREWLFWDGGAGTLLQARGLAGGELPERWNLTRQDDIFVMHSEYLRAGADIINTNTFGANRLKYPDDLTEIVTAGVEIAKRARIEAGRDDAYIALDMGPTGKLLEPLGDLKFEEAIEIFGEIVRAGDAAGADLVLIETMSDTYELKAAVLAAKENSDLPVFATVTFDSTGKLLTGGTVKAVVALLEGLRVDALGVNCSLGPEEMAPIVEEFVREASIPVIVTPNAGLPRTESGRTVYDVDPTEFASAMAGIAGKGVQILGGCCGTTPEHIAKMIESCRNIGFVPAQVKRTAYVTTFARAVEICDRTVVVGERINPTGKKKFKEALRSGDIPYILGEGIKQEESGADILDVNVGLPEIDEPEMMERVIRELQSVTSLPLQIDTSDPAALERGMRAYNGKPMINSVNGKAESMDAVFPLVRKYGGVVVALPLDEDGIPETAEGRIEIADRIYARAAEYGIDAKDIVIDGLTLAISSGGGMARAALDTIRRVRAERGGRTILGVSNVSFGLPCRGLINANFLTMAMASGLSCAIINPGNEAMMDAYRASLALLDADDNCAGYIDRYKDASDRRTIDTAGSVGTIDNTTSSTEALSLAECIERGLAEDAGRATRLELESREGTDIINEELIPALDRVGKGFEDGSVFLPQLLMSAEAAKAAFSVIKDAMGTSEQDTKGRMILATVKGDIHDIGKNIVKVMLENYGYEVLDLGKDVPPETIVDKAIEEDIKLVGLSALMTTTVVSMEDTIKLLREKKPDTKVVVGGAVLTQEYADMIGADHYASDAMATVRYADEVFGI